MLARRVVVLYGSQTGTTEDVAGYVGRELRRLHFDTTVAAMDAYDKVSVGILCNWQCNIPRSLS